jgi:RNA polymerase sigma-70 factor (ECF subfamily)
MRMFASPSPDEGLASRESAKELVGRLFGEWYGPLVRYAFRSTRSMESAEDIVQTSFTELYRAILEGKAIGNPKGWTLCVVRREIVNRLREQKRHGGVFLPLAETDGAAAVAASPPGWEEADLTKLLGVLSAREEEVLLLRAKALKYRQIAAELKISINSVKTLLARAVRKMQQASAAGGGIRGGWKRNATGIPETLQ